MKMSLQKSRDIYYLATKPGIKVYDLNNNFIGTTTGYTSMAHDGGGNGGSACLETPMDLLSGLSRWQFSFMAWDLS